MGDVLLSITRTSVKNGIDPVDYLSVVASHPDDVRRSPKSWLPWNYQKNLKTLN